MARLAILLARLFRLEKGLRFGWRYFVPGCWSPQAMRKRSALRPLLAKPRSPSLVVMATVRAIPDIARTGAS